MYVCMNEYIYISLSLSCPKSPSGLWTKFERHWFHPTAPSIPGWVFSGPYPTYQSDEPGEAWLAAVDQAATTRHTVYPKIVILKRKMNNILGTWGTVTLYCTLFWFGQIHLIIFFDLCFMMNSPLARLEKRHL